RTWLPTGRWATGPGKTSWPTGCRATPEQPRPAPRPGPATSWQHAVAISPPGHGPGAASGGTGTTSGGTGATPGGTGATSQGARATPRGRPRRPGGGERGEEAGLSAPADQAAAETGPGEGEDRQRQPAGAGDQAVGVPAAPQVHRAPAAGRQGGQPVDGQVAP